MFPVSNFTIQNNSISNQTAHPKQVTLLWYSEIPSKQNSNFLLTFDVTSRPYLQRSQDDRRVNKVRHPKEQARNVCTSDR